MYEEHSEIRLRQHVAASEFEDMWTCEQEGCVDILYVPSYSDEYEICTTTQPSSKHLAASASQASTFDQNFTLSQPKCLFSTVSHFGNLRPLRHFTLAISNCTLQNWQKPLCLSIRRGISQGPSGQPCRRERERERERR